MGRRRLRAAVWQDRFDPLPTFDDRRWQADTQNSSPNERWRSTVVAPDIADAGHLMALAGFAFFVLGVPLFLGLAEASFLSAVIVASSYLGLGIIAGAVLEWSFGTQGGLVFAVMLLPAYLILAAMAWCVGRVVPWLLRLRRRR